MASSHRRFGRHSFLVAAGLCLAFASAAQAADVVPAADRNFAEKAAAGGAAEVQAGGIASRKAESDKVRQFGQRMVEDHGKANRELKEIARAKNLDLPDQPDAKSRKTIESMQNLSGSEFDRAYMEHMVEDHKKDVEAFEKEAQSGKDAEIKAFAARTLPTLREHLELAKKTSAAVKNDKGGASKAANR